MKQPNIHNKQQSGQAIVLIAMVMVALIASLGLAVDGGGMFLLHRDVQNATDAAALSAAFALCTGGDPVDAAEISAALNGFETDIDGAIVTVENPPLTGTYAGNDGYVSVQIEAEKEAYFIQIVYTSELFVRAKAISQCQDAGAFGWPDNSAIVGLSQGCAASSGGSQSSPVRVTGGSTTTTIGGGIYINTAAGACPDAADTNGAGSGIVAGGYGICSDESYSGNVTASEGQLSTPCIEYEQITDPDPFVTAGLAAPTCSGASQSLSNGTNSPGNYSSFDISPGNSVYLESGVYCITDASVSWKGNIESDDTDGVFLYFNGSILSTLSQPNIELWALSDSSSDYTNLLMWFDTTAAPSNSVDVDISAGSDLYLEGTIYAPRHHCNLAGSGTGIIYGQIICYSADNNGNGPVTIIYNPSRSFDIPPDFGVTE